MEEKKGWRETEKGGSGERDRERRWDGRVSRKNAEATMGRTVGELEAQMRKDKEEEVEKDRRRERV